LLANNGVQRHKTSKKELDKLRAAPAVLFLNAAWMKSAKTAETLEVRGVQSQDMAHVVNEHSRCQSRIVRLNAQDPVLHNNPPPFSVNCFAIRQQSHAGLDCPHLALSLSNRQAEAITGKRPSHRVPKLGDVLVGVMEDRTLESKSGQRCVYELVLGIRTACHA
jgi:hypothetical protein